MKQLNSQNWQEREEKINSIKLLFQQIDKIQESLYTKLVEDLNIEDKTTEECLFDYIYNDSDENTFKEYCDKYGSKPSVPTIGEIRF